VPLTILPEVCDDQRVGYVLAQVNIGRLTAPLDSPRIAGFVAALDSVNAVADAAPGFVWRLQTEDGNATRYVPSSRTRRVRTRRVLTAAS
jgi:hypothetical protein